MRIGKYKLVNTKRFVGFCLIIICIISFIIACYKINKITVTTINRNKQIQEELKNAVIIPIEEYYK